MLNQMYIYHPKSLWRPSRLAIDIDGHLYLGSRYVWVMKRDGDNQQTCWALTNKNRDLPQKRDLTNTNGGLKWFEYV